MALYPGNDPDIQEVVSDHVTARVARTLGIADDGGQAESLANVPLA